MKPLSLSLLLFWAFLHAEGFLVPRISQGSRRLNAIEPRKAEDVADSFRASFRTANEGVEETVSETATENADANSTTTAVTSTINERLLAELEEATQKEKFGSRSELTDKIQLDKFFPGSTKTEAERQAAIAEARNLNGVNPVVTGVASVVALAAAAALWQATTALGVFLAQHPVDADSWYVVQRSSVVVRNVAVGLVSLAAGFCGVTGLGIGLLTIRVAIGVAKGELDPTPLPTAAGDELKLPNVFGLMMGKKQKDLFDP